MKTMKIVTIVLLAAFLFGCPGKNPTPESFIFNPTTGEYTHGKSGFVFPSNVGNFKINETKQYDPSGLDVSAGYSMNEPQRQGLLTVYVYPAIKDYSIFPVPQLGKTPEKFIVQHYEGVKDEIINYYRAELVSEEEANFDIGGGNRPGRKATFRWSAADGQKVLSHLYLFVHEGWFIKYRITHHEKQESLVNQEVAQFMSKLAWP
jgi:hypothetical protein